MSDQPRTVMTERSNMPHDTAAETPAGIANIRVVVLPALQLVLVRAARTFIQTFLAALGLGALGPSLTGVSDVLPPGSASEKLLAALYVGLLAALISALQNAAELLGKWDVDRPELRA